MILDGFTTFMMGVLSLAIVVLIILHDKTVERQNMILTAISARIQIAGNGNGNGTSLRANVNGVLFGDPLDILMLAKVPSRAEGQTIRRATRLGYEPVMRMEDKAGTTYVVFQLCPTVGQLMPTKKVV